MRQILQQQNVFNHLVVLHTRQVQEQLGRLEQRMDQLEGWLMTETDEGVTRARQTAELGYRLIRAEQAVGERLAGIEARLANLEN